MTFARRFTALLLQAALLALPLTGMRANCPAGHESMADMSGMANMPGMSMPDSGNDDHHECPADVALHCDNMLLCGAALMVVEPFAVVGQITPGTAAALQIPRDPLSVTRAPEPPPPRS